MDLGNTLRAGVLLDVYGALLTGKQRQVLNSYINFNGSLAEIAQDLAVTRQAVGDLIRRTLKVLEDYDSKLSLIKKIENTKVAIKGTAAEEKINKIWK